MDPELEEDDTTCEASEGTLSQTGVLSLVWRKDVLGAAWVESSSSVLKFCQVADPAPDFRVMQSLKYSLDPTLIVTPSTSDPDYLDKLGGTCHPVAASAAEAEDAEEGAADPDEANGFMVTLCKNREFSAESAIQRLSLLRNLVDLPSCELSDRERQMHLEHILPPDQEQACRAIAPLECPPHPITPIHPPHLPLTRPHPPSPTAQCHVAFSLVSFRRPARWSP